VTSTETTASTMASAQEGATEPADEEELLEEDDVAEESPVPVAEDDDEIMKLIGKSKPSPSKGSPRKAPAASVPSPRDQTYRRERKPSFRVLEAEQHAVEAKEENAKAAEKKPKKNLHA